jgi:predicted Zn finger-like uncharacterized protein
VSNAVTQCPHCYAKFRVRAEQVRAHAGLVRCGACRGIFDARLNLIEGTLGDIEEDFDAQGSPQTIIAGMPPIARTPSDEEVRAAAREGVAKQPASSRKDAVGSRSADAAAQASAATTDADYDWRAPQQPLTGKQKFGYATLSLLAALALVLQLGYWFRDELANRFPVLTPSIKFACSHLNCLVLPPRRAEQIGFVGAELSADPAHKGLLIFTATLRNLGDRAVAFPSLVLTLEGTNGEPIARRIFTPDQYAPAQANLAQGLPGATDLEVKLYLDASPAAPLGFKADHAYLPVK